MSWKWTKWELKGRVPTQKHAEASAKLLLSTMTKKQARIIKEGREWSVYTRKKILKRQRGVRYGIG